MPFCTSFERLANYSKVNKNLSVLQTKEIHHLKTAQQEVVELKSKLEGLKAVEADNKKLNVLFVEKEKELEQLQETLKSERDEKMDLLQVCCYFQS